MSIGNLITQLFIWNFDKISVFKAVTVSCAKSYHSEKLLTAVNNTTGTEIWQLMTCQFAKWFVGHTTEINSMQTSAHWYSWQADNNGYALPPENDVSKTSVFNGSTSVLLARMWDIFE